MSRSKKQSQEKNPKGSHPNNQNKKHKMPKQPKRTAEEKAQAHQDRIAKKQPQRNPGKTPPLMNDHGNNYQESYNNITQTPHADPGNMHGEHRKSSDRQSGYRGKPPRQKWMNKNYSNGPTHCRYNEYDSYDANNTGDQWMGNNYPNNASYQHDRGYDNYEPTSHTVPSTSEQWQPNNTYPNIPPSLITPVNDRRIVNSEASKTIPPNTTNAVPSVQNDWLIPPVQQTSSGERNPPIADIEFVKIDDIDPEDGGTKSEKSVSRDSPNSHKLEQDIARLNERVGTLQQLLSMKDQELADSRQRLDHYQDLVSDYRQQRNDAQKQRDWFQQRLVEADAKIAELESRGEDGAATDQGSHKTNSTCEYPNAKKPITIKLEPKFMYSEKTT